MGAVERATTETATRPTRAIVAALLLLGLFAGVSCVRKSGSTSGPTPEQVLAAYEDTCANSFREVPALLPAQLDHLRRQREVVLVDVRSEIERVVSMVEGAVAVGDFDLNKERYRNHVVVAYCTIGVRSGSYAEQLRYEGFDSRNLKGGILLCAHGGAMLVDSGGKPTKRLHVCSEEWNYAPEGYEAVW